MSIRSSLSLQVQCEVRPSVCDGGERPEDLLTAGGWWAVRGCGAAAWRTSSCDLQVIARCWRADDPVEHGLLIYDGMADDEANISGGRAVLAMVLVDGTLWLSVDQPIPLRSLPCQVLVSNLHVQWLIITRLLVALALPHGESGDTECLSWARSTFCRRLVVLNEQYRSNLARGFESSEQEK